MCYFSRKGTRGYYLVEYVWMVCMSINVVKVSGEIGRSYETTYVS
jgi:hypothetical protein